MVTNQIKINCCCSFQITIHTNNFIPLNARISVIFALFEINLMPCYLKLEYKATYFWKYYQKIFILFSLYYFTIISTKYLKLHNNYLPGYSEIIFLTRPRLVSLFEVERYQDRDWAPFLNLSDTDTESGLVFLNWTIPIPSLVSFFNERYRYWVRSRFLKLMILEPRPGIEM